MQHYANILALAISLFALVETTTSFQPIAFSRTGRCAELRSASSGDVGEPKLTESGLPEVKGDFDWDEKFSGDDDWITENVPGKIVLDDLTLAKQVGELDKLEEKWRKERWAAEYEADRQIGFVARAETMNGRFAMFFLVTGLLTEYWTGISMPGQVEEMLRVGGVIGFDG